MSNPYVGQLGAVGIAKETTFGTFVAPTTFLATELPTQIGSPEIDLLLAKGVRSIPDVVYKAQQGAAHAKSLKLKTELEPENCGEILEAAFGTDTISGSGPYTHTFTMAAKAQPSSQSLWVNNGATQINWSGCMLSKLVFDIKAGQFVTTEADFLGSKYASGTTHSPSYSALYPFKFDQVTFTVGGSGVTLYKDIKLTIDKMAAIDPLIGGSIYSNVVYQKGLMLELAATIVVEDTTEWAKFTAGTATSFIIALTSTQQTSGVNYSLTFNIPVAYYKSAPMPLANGLIEIPFVAQGVYDTSTTKTINAVLVNSITPGY